MSISNIHFLTYMTTVWRPIGEDIFQKVLGFFFLLEGYTLSPMWRLCRCRSDNTNRRREVENE